MVKNQAGGTNDLTLGADAPLRAAAAVPLTDEAGLPLPPAHVGEAGHALSLSDQQVLMVLLGKCEPYNIAFETHLGPILADTQQNCCCLYCKTACFAPCQTGIH